MSLELTPEGKHLFSSDIFRRANPKFDDFHLKRDGGSWIISCPGKNIKYPVARFTGPFVEGARALKMQLITSRLCM